MLELSRITAEDVEQAIAEHDRLGRDAFLQKHGFGKARTYLVRHGGRLYDSKALIGVAHRNATGRVAGSDEFSGGLTGAVWVLRDLGFEVVDRSQQGAARAGASDLDRLVAALGDGDRAVRPKELSDLEPQVLDRAGLYSWFVDHPGAAELSAGLGHPLGAGLIYVGQTGATKWPSGRASGSTLRQRLQRQHLRGRRSASTFRKTLGAVLDEARGTAVVRQDLTVWMNDHLRVVAVAVDDVETLGAVEEQVVERLEPPLNLDHAGPSDVRTRLRSLRSRAVSAD